ncbi:MAG: hypothetical protein B7X43_04745 [Thiomonas sp. 15-63-373]|nr:MAG: hypothetical protein B7X43_04745 [Thiomonas sp. 15-63-373]
MIKTNKATRGLALAFASMALMTPPELAAAAPSGLPSLGATVQPAKNPSGAAALAQSSVPWTPSSEMDAAGITVTRYVNTAGTVFAVSWDGPAKPDLKQLLGTYFGSMPSEIGSQIATSQLGDLVVYSSGSMPHFSGYAYLKSQTPSGFSIKK